MDDHARAQPRRIDVGASAGKILAAQVGVHVLVVRLEHANRQTMVEPRRLIVHSAAHRKVRTPLEAVVVRSVNACCTDQCMSKRSDIVRWEAENYAPRVCRKSIVVPVGSNIASIRRGTTPLVFSKLRPEYQRIVEVIRAAEWRRRSRHRRNKGEGAICLWNLNCSFGAR